MNNPLDELDNPQVRQPEYWGEISIDAYYAVLTKGVGKEVFNPQIHSLDKRVTAIDMKLTPIAAMGITFGVERGMIAESKEYAGIVLASIKALGIPAKELNGKYVKLGYVPSGRTYIDKTSGETKDSTTFKFLKVFASQAECEADYNAARGFPTATSQPAAPWTADPAPVAPNGKERETAFKFLKIFAENAAHGQSDITVIQNSLASHIAANPIVSKHFTADSTEALNLIAEAMTK